MAFTMGPGPDNDGPTPKQIRYAKRLGIDVTPDMTRGDLSDLIGQAEQAEPELKEEREHIKEKGRERKYGEETIEAEQEWNEFANGVEFMLAVYRHRHEIVVDVLRVNGAEISNRGKVVLEVEAPKGYKDPDIGPSILWERYFRLPVDDLLYHEPLYKEFGSDHDTAVALYRHEVERGLEIARQLRGRGQI